MVSIRYSLSISFLDNLTYQGHEITALRNDIRLKASPGEWISLLPAPRLLIGCPTQTEFLFFRNSRKTRI